jgi:hypothetical protein
MAIVTRTDPEYSIGNLAGFEARLRPRSRAAGTHARRGKAPGVAGQGTRHHGTGTFQVVAQYSEEPAVSRSISPSNSSMPCSRTRRSI